jgi:hypothetical protein
MHGSMNIERKFNFQRKANSTRRHTSDSQLLLSGAGSSKNTTMPQPHKPIITWRALLPEVTFNKCNVCVNFKIYSREDH